MRKTEQRILAVGCFDGVHLGHQAILRGASAALTFRTHPLAVLAPSRAPRFVMTLAERIAAIKACGVGEVTALDFTPALAAVSAADFAAEYLSADVIRCGADWHFGAGGEGDADFLRAHGIAVEVVPYAVYAGGRISSSRIREALSRGEIESANAMMGRNFTVHGVAFKGKGLGRRIGFPTLNLRLDGVSPVLPCGVYEVAVNGARGLANWGFAPTLGKQAWQEPVLELHFADGVVPPISAQVEVSFVRFLRLERKFASLADLQRQIAADCLMVLK